MLIALFKRLFIYVVLCVCCIWYWFRFRSYWSFHQHHQWNLFKAFVRCMYIIQSDAKLQWLYNLLLFDVVFLMIIYALAERKKFVLVLIITQRWVAFILCCGFRIITLYGQLRFFTFCIFIANWNIFGVHYLLHSGTELYGLLFLFCLRVLGVIDLARLPQ